jgi:hypothetical protein
LSFLGKLGMTEELFGEDLLAGSVLDANGTDGAATSGVQYSLLIIGVSGREDGGFTTVIERK